MQCLRTSAGPWTRAVRGNVVARFTPLTITPSFTPFTRLFSTALTSTPLTTTQPLSALLRARTSLSNTSAPSPLTSLSTATSIFSTTINNPTSSRTFSSSAILAAPRNTYNPSHRRRKRRHGFLSRIKTRTGRMTLMRRRQKGRQNLSH